MAPSRSAAADLVAALHRRLQPGDAASLGNLAWFAVRREQHHLAIQFLGDAMRLPGTPAFATAALAQLRANQPAALTLTPCDPGMVLQPSAPAVNGSTNALAAAIAAHTDADYEAAEACYRAALAVPYASRAAYNGLGVLHEQRHESRAADDAWRTAVAAGSVAARHNQALSLLRRGLIVAAREHLTPVLDDPALPAAVLFLAGYAALHAGDAQQAANWLTLAVARDADCARAQFALGLALGQLGRPAESLLAVRRALWLSPWYVPQVWLLEGQVGDAWSELAAGGATPEAMPPPSPPPSLDRDSAEPGDDMFLAFGRALMGAGHFGEALAVFDQVLAQRPSHPTALFHRGVVLAKLRRYHEALDDWETVERGPVPRDLAQSSRRHAESARQLAMLFDRG